MTRYFLSQMKIEGFRGINNDSEPLEVKFDPAAVNSLFAGNAVGKSSIFEALCYAIKGTIPKLDLLQTQEKPQDYYANRFHSKGVADISLAFMPDDGGKQIEITVQRNKAGGRIVKSPSGHPDPEKFLESLNEDFTLLDYHAFIRFIDSSPLDRGRSFSALLGLSAYSEYRQALQSVADTRSVNTDFDVAAENARSTAALTAMQVALKRLTNSYNGLTGKPFADVSEIDAYTADILAALNGIDLIKDKIGVKRLAEVNFDDVTEVIKAAEGGEKRAAVVRAGARVAALEALSPVEGYKDDSGETRALLVKREELIEKTKGESLKQLFDAADSLLGSGEWTEERICPLCKSSLDTAISEIIKSELAEYDAVTDLEAEIQVSWGKSAWAGRLKLLSLGALTGAAEAKVELEPIEQAAKDGVMSVVQLDAAVRLMTALEASQHADLTDATAQKVKLEAELPASLVALSGQVEHARTFNEALAEYDQARATQQAAQSKLAAIEKWRGFIVKAATTFAEAEAEMSGNKIKEIETDYKDLFARIMAVKDVIPELKRDTARQDLHVQLSDFHGVPNVSARALLSESYRNALAISVFLTAAMKHTGAPRFIVLDDVTSSFDSGHQYNLMEAIRQVLQQPGNKDGLQFIILSHDGLLEKYFDRIGGTKDWKHQRLQGWPPLGNVMCNAQDANRLSATATNFLNAGQTQQAEPLIRQYLEFKLKQVIDKVRIPVPLDFAIKDHMKMVSNCLDAIKAATELQKKAGTLVLDSAQVKALDTVLVPALVGNWVAHYETGMGSGISAPMLLSIIKTIDDFAECFRHDVTVNGKIERRWYTALDKK